MANSSNAMATVASGEVITDPWQRVMTLACQMSVDIPVPRFHVNELMLLRPQVVLDTCWRVGSDVPVRVNGQLIGWGEFDTVQGRLAVRLTEVASQ